MTIRHARGMAKVAAKSRTRSWIKPFTTAALLSAAALMTSVLAASSAEDGAITTTSGDPVATCTMTLVHGEKPPE